MGRNTYERSIAASEQGTADAVRRSKGSGGRKPADSGMSRRDRELVHALRELFSSPVVESNPKGSLSGSSSKSRLSTDKGKTSTSKSVRTLEKNAKPAVPHSDANEIWFIRGNHPAAVRMKQKRKRAVEESKSMPEKVSPSAKRRAKRRREKQVTWALAEKTANRTTEKKLKAAAAIRIEHARRQAQSHVLEVEEAFGGAAALWMLSRVVPKDVEYKNVTWSPDVVVRKEGGKSSNVLVTFKPTSTRHTRDYSRINPKIQLANTSEKNRNCHVQGRNAKPKKPVQKEVLEKTKRLGVKKLSPSQLRRKAERAGRKEVSTVSTLEQGVQTQEIEKTMAERLQFSLDQLNEVLTAIRAGTSVGDAELESICRAKPQVLVMMQKNQYEMLVRKANGQLNTLRLLDLSSSVP